MALRITDNARAALQQSTKEPNIVLEIDGLPDIIGASVVREFVRIGGGIEEPEQDDPVPEIGDPETSPLAYYIGGFTPVALQENIISLDGTSTSIKQTLNVDKGQGTTVSSLAVSLIDDGFATKLISPGELLEDLLYRKVRVYFGFQGTAWPEDYVTIFKGFVVDVESEAGKVTLQLSHPEEKKRSNIFKKVESELPSAITNSQTTIDLVSTANMLKPITGPDGNIDSSFEAFVRIDDEVIKYTGITGNQLTGCVRGQLGTLAASHDAEAKAETIYRLRGNGIDLALKLMSSGYNGPYLEEMRVDRFGSNGDEIIPRSLFFSGKDLADRFGVVAGDYVTVTGSTPANNFTLKQIESVTVTDEGTTVVLVDQDVVAGSFTGSVAAFRSQFDTLPDGCKMAADDIDVEEHLRLKRLFLSSVIYDFRLKDTIEEAKDFIEQQIYSPMAAYSLPRKARASIGYHIGPIPGANLKTYSKANIKNPGRVRIRRSVNRQFYNEIVYKFDQDILEDRFLAGFIGVSATSKNRIQGANKTLVIESQGLRSVDLADTIAQQQSLRRLNRYEFGAEVISFEVLLQDGFEVEIGDIIIFDGKDLALPDIKTGLRDIQPRFLEVQNKEFQLKTGNVRLEAVDTAFTGSARYGLISPASRVKLGIDTETFVIESSYSSRFGDAEWRKWERFAGARVRVRSENFATIGTASFSLQPIQSNTITLAEPLPFVPSAGMYMELAPYSEQPDEIKLIFAFQSDGANDFLDGRTPYKLL